MILFVIRCRAMMMTACDVSAITKPWPIQQTVSNIMQLIIDDRIM